MSSNGHEFGFVLFLKWWVIDTRTSVLQPSNGSDQYRDMILLKGQKNFRLHSSNFHEQMSEQSGKIQPGNSG